MGLDSVELLMRVEFEFGVDITDEEASAIVTVGDLHSCLVRNWDSKAGTDEQRGREPSWQALCDVIVDELGLNPEQIAPNVSLVRDLGID